MIAEGVPLDVEDLSPFTDPTLEAILERLALGLTNFLASVTADNGGRSSSSPRGKVVTSAMVFRRFARDIGFSSSSSETYLAGLALLSLSCILFPSCAGISMGRPILD